MKKNFEGADAGLALHLSHCAPEMGAACHLAQITSSSRPHSSAMNKGGRGQRFTLFLKSLHSVTCILQPCTPTPLPCHRSRTGPGELIHHRQRPSPGPRGLMRKKAGSGDPSLIPRQCEGAAKAAFPGEDRSLVLSPCCPSWLWSVPTN